VIGRVAQRVHEIVEPAFPGDVGSRIFDHLMVALIISNVVAAVLHSIEALAGRYAGIFSAVEIATVVVFSVEYGARLWTCPLGRSVRYRRPLVGRLRFAVSMYALVDLMAILPFYVGLLITIDPHLAHVLPILRVLKLMRYSPALETLGVVFYTERRALLAAGTIMLVLLLFSSSLVYLVERSAQPEVFASIPDAMWWGIATLTTVGYGDITPITPLGKLFGSIVTVLGIAMFALPAAILATGFAQVIKQRDFLVTWKLVASVPSFSQLAADEIARIAMLLEPMVVQPGQVVIRRGDRADAMFFVVSGELVVDLGDRLIPLEGDFFGEMGVLGTGDRSASVIASTRAQLLALEARNLEAFFDSHPELAAKVRRVATERQASLAEPGEKTPT
jgi:voltage-gated potassium channel